LIEISAGEQQKSIATFGGLCRRLVDLGLDRQSVLVALGGGVVGDLGGFVAASYMRGIPYLQVPTTLLAQVDSSVGGKTAVNLPEGKNLVGAFYQPVGVYIDSSVLTTLADRDLQAGMVEVLKYGVIRDAQFFQWLESNLDSVLALDGPAVLHAVRRSCEIKADVVAADEREGGLRAILNYGHTCGHAVEALSTYGRYRHGEAVAIGMEAAAMLSRRHLGFAERDAQRQHELLQRIGVPTRIEDLSVEEIVEKMASDKKTVGGQLRFILARNLGEVEICADVPRSMVREALAACGAGRNA
jgi:3-dehydroquinate synthase